MIYEKITDEEGNTTIKQTLDNGLEKWIPTNFANSDYQEYLKSLEVKDAN
jgi:hypothetical protein